jgi:L-lactate dehydrogenase complex protein LldE
MVYHGALRRRGEGDYSGARGALYNLLQRHALSRDGTGYRRGSRTSRCGGRLSLLAGDGRLTEQVEELGPKVFELSEFLVRKLGVSDVGAYYPHRVTYHPTCHSLRMLRVGDAPLELLRNVRGIDLVELSGAEECCGFGGTFAVKNADTSAAMLSDKIRRVLDTEAEVCSAGDNSCLMHIGGGLARLRTGVETVHLAQILASKAEEG